MKCAGRLVFPFLLMATTMTTRAFVLRVTPTSSICRTVAPASATSPPQEPEEILPSWWALTEKERSELRAECAAIIQTGVAQGLEDLQQLHDRWQGHLAEDLLPLHQAMTLNAMRESEDFSIKTDALVGSFLHQTAGSRARTRALYQEVVSAEHEKEKAAGQVKGSHDNNGWQSWKKTNDAWDSWDGDKDW
jgi:hypothetical protein